MGGGVVFDCSAKYKGISLNGMMLPVSDMTNDLLGLLCRFRKEPTAISCDIEKMFYQFLSTKNIVTTCHLYSGLMMIKVLNRLYTE